MSANKWTGNNVLRQGQIEKFTSQLQHCIDTISFKESIKHSIVYNTIVASCKQLIVSYASHRYLAVYSDLRENSVVSFYNPTTLDSLKKFPASIEKRLTALNPLPNLDGITVWLVYQPTSYEDNQQYMVIAQFFKHLFEEHGATVRITNQLSAP